MRRSLIFFLFAQAFVVQTVQGSGTYTSYSIETDSDSQTVTTVGFSCTAPHECSFDSPTERLQTDSHLFELARNSLGEFYCLNFDDHTLNLLDVEQGTLQPISTLQIYWDTDDYCGMAFDEEDQLWISSGWSLHRIDPEDGASLEEIFLGSDLSALAFHLGRVYGAEGRRVYEIDMETGAMTTVVEYDSPWSSGRFYLLSSDGEDLWALLGSVGEPGPPEMYELYRVASDSGELIPVGSYPRYWQYPLGIVISKHSVQPEFAVPDLGMPGFVTLILLIAIGGVFVFRRK